MSDSEIDTSQDASAVGSLPIEIELEYMDRVNFSMQQSGVRAVEAVRLTSTADAPIEGLRLSLEITAEACPTWERPIDRIDPGTTVAIVPEDLRLDPRAMAQRTEAERASVIVRVTTEDAAAERRFDIDLLAFDQWPGVGHFPELTAAFVTPNHPHIAELLGYARSALGALAEHDALDGYQSGSRRRAAMIAEAGFNALASWGVGYANPPASFERTGQRVRLVDRVQREKLGTCLDLSLLLASIWEQCGLHPMILLPEGHALPAVWTHDAHLPEPAIDEAARIRNLVELGEIVPVEVTLLTQKGATFGVAVEAARQRLESPGADFCAVDVRSARKRGVRPLPLRSDSSETEVDLDAANAPIAPSMTQLDAVDLADRVGGGRGQLPVFEESAPDRIRRWQTRLLDLSLRNRLINFRETGRTIRLMVPDVAMAEDILASEQRLGLLPKTDGDEAYRSEQLEARQVHTAETPAETARRLLQLYRLSRSGIEETGANLLHVAIGMLKWYESASSDVPRRAPLILLPARLIRHATGGGYRYEVELSDEPLRPNVTLLEKIRSEFGIDTGGLEDFPEDDTGLDVPLILRNFREAIRDTARWEVEESLYLGLFSFNKFLMWRDLQENLERLRENRLVEHLVEGAVDVFDPEPFPDPARLDDEVPPGDLLCTRNADSTQLAAIRAASEGRTFVLEGPPGTGKSQTIANMIADALASGKRVLFVAEKMAALSVVRRRLEQDGLGPYCLELHSAKASKKEVLRQLDEGLHAAAAGEPATWSNHCEELAARRTHLNAYVRALHRPRPSGETLYRVLGRLTHLGDGPRVNLPMDDPLGVEQARLAEWRGRVRDVVEAAAPVDPVAAHPLRGVERSRWDFTLPQQAEGVLTEATRQLDDLEARCDVMLGEVEGIGSAGLPAEVVPSLVKVFELLLSCPEPSPPDGRMIRGGDAAGLRRDLMASIELGRQRDAARDALMQVYREEFLELEHITHIDVLARTAGLPGPIRSVLGFFRTRKYRAYCRGRLPSLVTLRDDMERARTVKQQTEQLRSAGEASACFGRHWSNGEADWSALAECVEWCAALEAALEPMQRRPELNALVDGLVRIACDASQRAGMEGACRDAVDAWRAWCGAWAEVSSVLNASDEEARREDVGWIETLSELLERWRSATPELDNWCTWRRAREAAAGAGLEHLLQQYECGDAQRGELTDVFERSFGEAWFNAVANASEPIREFNAASHARTIERFRDLDREHLDLTRRLVAARLRASAPTGTAQASAQSEMGILRRELEKKRRHMPTRRLIEAMPNLLPRLKPCFLMSPLSVAQYLDAALPPFDMVIFDEASQIPVWDAIGAIARGAEVIVVGDSKQLPPTTFFATLDGEDELDPEDTAVEDMESILKECNASGIPPMRLSWHYRSRHESLITFSNHHYYNNELHTFPSPEERSDRLGVTFRYVEDGIYDRGGSRTNRIEAQRVVEMVVEMLLSPEHDKSIGIVTFNQAQQGLIEDLLDERRRAEPGIEPYFTEEVEEPVFVKNLENVQGDERDTIIFSVGYGPDETGRPSMNFGPLNKEGGERRLNVAVTRARRRLIVFSSLRSDQIDLRRTRSIGVRHFKTFLDYADRGPRAIAEAVDQRSTHEFESGFERAVWKALTDRGWDVDTQIGCAGYRVDLGVRDPDRPGRYLIGIECDGAAYHSARTARDRDRIRQSVLEGLGWRLERIWSTEWRVNPGRCIAAIEEAIEASRTGAVPEPEPETEAREPTPGAVEPPEIPETPFHGASPVTPTADTDEATAAPAEAEGLPMYCRAEPSSDRFARLDFFERVAMQSAMEALTKIITGEGPIVEELALRRVAQWFGVQRVTDRFRERFIEVRDIVLSTQPVRLEADVFWPGGMLSGTYRDCRVPGTHPDDQRDLDDIPLAERANGVVHVLKTQFGLPRDELVREVARLFGVQRVTPRVRESVDAAIDLAIQRSEARVDGDRVVIG